MNQLMSSLGYTIFKILANFEIVFVQRKGTRIFFLCEISNMNILKWFPGNGALHTGIIGIIVLSHTSSWGHRQRKVKALELQLAVTLQWGRKQQHEAEWVCMK